MDAVGADNELRGNRRHGVEMKLDAVGRLRKPNTPATKVNGIGLFAQQCLRDHAMQVAAMDGDVRRSVTLDRFHAEIEQLPALPGIPQPDGLAGRLHLYFLERILEPERMQHAGAVGADLHAGAEFAQLRRLLVDIDIDAAADQRERRREPADSAADDDDFFRHSGCGLRRLAGGIAAQIDEHVVTL